MFRAILIDSDWTSLTDTAKFLRENQKNFKVERTYTSFEKALTCLRQHYFHVIIVNTDIPDFDVLELMRIAQKESNNTKFILLSKELNFEIVREAMKLGAYDFLQNPVNTQELLESLDCLSRSLSAAIGYIKYSKNDVLPKREIMFSDLLSGQIKTPVDLHVRIHQAGLDDNYINRECALINVHINSFSTWLAECWYGGIGKFNKIFSEKFSKSNDKFDLICTRTFYNNIELLAINNSQLPIEKILSGFLPSIPQEIMEVFNLYCEVRILRIFSSVSEIMKYNIYEPVNIEIKSEEIIENAVKYIRHNYFRDITLEDAANYVMLSREYFCKYYKQKTGETFFATLTKHRIESAKMLLENTDLTVWNIAESVGYRSVSHFQKTFKKLCGITPSDYRQQNISK